MPIKFKCFIQFYVNNPAEKCFAEDMVIYISTRYGYIHIDEIWLYTYRRDMVIYKSMIYGYIHIDEIYIYEYNTNIVREVWVKVNWLERERERERNWDRDWLSLWYIGVASYPIGEDCVMTYKFVSHSLRALFFNSWKWDANICTLDVNSQVFEPKQINYMAEMWMANCRPSTNCLLDFERSEDMFLHRCTWFVSQVK